MQIPMTTSESAREDEHARRCARDRNRRRDRSDRRARARRGLQRLRVQREGELDHRARQRDAGGDADDPRGPATARHQAHAGRQISADLRQRRRHRADAGRGEPGNCRRAAVGPRSRAAEYSSLGLYRLCRQRGRQPAHRDRHRRQEGGGGGGGRRRAGRRRGQPRRQDRGGDLGDHQHGAFHRHRELPDHR